jgi:hypothetical protein
MPRWRVHSLVALGATVEVLVALESMAGTRHGRSRLLRAGALGHRTAAPTTRRLLIVKTYALLRDAIAPQYTKGQLTNARYASTIKAIASLKDSTSLVDPMSVLPGPASVGRSALNATKRAFLMSVIRTVTLSRTLSSEGQAGRSRRRGNDACGPYLEFGPSLRFGHHGPQHLTERVTGNIMPTLDSTVLRASQVGSKLVA